MLGLEKLTLSNFIQDPADRTSCTTAARSQPLAGRRSDTSRYSSTARSYGVYLALESSDETGFLGRSFASTALLYEGEYGADLYLNQAFDEDYGDDPDRSTLTNVIEDFNNAGDASLMQDTADTIDWNHVQGQMALELLVELAVAAPRPERGGEPHEERAQRPHDADSPGVMKRARIAVACSHSRASFSSCLRPARVSV